jgi:hypothetical protein
MAGAKGGIWNSILQFTIRHHSDGTRPSNFQEMDPSRKEFLKQAMEAMILDEVIVMKDILKILEMPESPEPLRQLAEVKESKLVLPSILELEKINPDLPLFKYVRGRQKQTEQATPSERGTLPETGSTSLTTAPTTTTTTTSNSTSTASSTTDSLTTSIPVEGEIEGKVSNQVLVDMVRATKENSLEELELLVDRLDAANDFAKIGGIPILVNLFETTTFDSVKARVLAVLGTCLQHNMVMQETLFKKYKLMNILLPLLCATSLPSTSGSPTEAKTGSTGSSTETLGISAELQNKAMFCLSALLRHYKPAEAQFCHIQAKAGMSGPELLLTLGTGIGGHARSIRVQRKALFLLEHLLDQLLAGAIDFKVQEKVSLEAQLRSLGAKSIPKLIGHTDIDLRENALRILLKLMNPRTASALAAFDDAPDTLQTQGSVAQVRTAAARFSSLKKLLRSRLETLLKLTSQEDREQVSEEVRLIATILKVLSMPPKDEGDRTQSQENLQNSEQEISTSQFSNTQPIVISVGNNNTASVESKQDKVQKKKKKKKKKKK